MNAFKSLANILCEQACLSLSENWNISEKEQQAQIKKCIIHFPGGQFTTIENDIYKSMFTKIQSYSSILKDEDCDGIAYTEYEGKKYIILVELKSKIDADVIKHAFDQLIFSFMKLNMILSICEGFDIKQYEFIGILACGLKKNQDISHIKDELMQKQTLHNGLNAMDRFFYKILKNDFNKKISEIHYFKNKNLKQEILNKDLKILLFPSEPCQDTINIDIENIC